MDPPKAVSVESKPNPKPEQANETKPNPKSYECGLCDTEVVYKIAQELLPGLASACVDNTTGGLFKNAGSVAVDMRKEMSDYLIQRSETYVAEFLLSENSPVLETSEHPYEIIITLIDDFTASKRNMLSRVSEWVFSDGREDRIDDFVQEMEVNGFWLLARRESIAETLLKNVDYKNSFHCNTVCGSEEEVGKHRAACKFRAMDCVNEGCTTRYCAAQKENHEANCPFLILPCEQKCPDFVMRREMDRHCVTICPMKVVNCAFYTVGCKSCIPKSNVQQHNVDDLSAHLLFIIRSAHKEANEDDLKKRVEQIRSLTNTEKLARARDARALTYLIKDAEAKLQPLEPKTKTKQPYVDAPDTPTQRDVNKIDPPTETEPLIVKDDSKLPTNTEPAVVKNESDSNPPTKKEDQPISQPANDVKPSTEKPAIQEVKQEPPKPVESTEKPATQEVKQEPPKPVESTEKPATQEVKQEPQKPVESTEKPVVKEVQQEPPKPVESTEKPAVKEVKQEPPKPVESTESQVKVDESKDKKESTSPPIVKEEKKSEPPLKKEEVAKDVKEEKNNEAPLKEEVGKDIKEEKGKTLDNKEEKKEKQPEGGKVEESVKPPVEEKKSPEKETTGEPAKAP